MLFPVCVLKHIYFFVTLIRTPDTDADVHSTVVKVTKDILKEYGFFEGKM
jgi:hypothetical protein